MFEKMKRVVMNNLVATIVLVVAVIMFLYHSRLDIIGGAIITVSGVVAGICATLLYKEYRATPAPSKSAKSSAKSKKKK